MEINIDYTSHIVEIWLTHQDKTDLETKKNLKEITQKYKNGGYIVAHYNSGNYDLEQKTTSLLLHNIESTYN